jgi:hypothetical protein
VVQLSPMPSAPVLEQANGHTVGQMLGHVGGPVGEIGEPNMQISNLAPSSEGPDPSASPVGATKCAAQPS